MSDPYTSSLQRRAWDQVDESRACLQSMYASEWRRIDGDPEEASPRRLSVTSAKWAELRSEVFARDDWTCTYCGARGTRLECDHIISVADGGSDRLENLTTACFTCNRKKGRKSGLDWCSS